MKKTNLKNKAGAVAAFAFAIISFAANAQKLPNIQKDGVLAPLNIKIDGKANEWDDTFQAYNKNTNTYYTIANDADNLYLVIQASDPNDINKITAGGITFTIKSADKKSAAAPITISYPIKTRVARPAGGPLPPGGITVMRVGINGGGGGGGARVASPMAKLRSNQPLTDSDLIALNKQINTNVKEIRVTGLKEFPDSTVSLYNEDGIHAAGLISLKKAYTIEYSIALKYLQPLINSAGTFNYNVQVNGLVMNIVQITDVSGGGGGGGGGAGFSGGAIRVDVAGPGGGGMPASFQSMTSPTDFSGSYTLAKK